MGRDAGGGLFVDAEMGLRVFHRLLRMMEAMPFMAAIFLVPVVEVEVVEQSGL